MGNLIDSATKWSQTQRKLIKSAWKIKYLYLAATGKTHTFLASSVKYCNYLLANFQSSTMSISTE